MKRTYRRKGLFGSRAGGELLGRDTNCGHRNIFSLCILVCIPLCISVLKNPPTKYLESDLVDWALVYNIEERGVKFQFLQITTLVERVIFV